MAGTGRSAFDRLLGVLVGLTAAFAALLATLQLDASRQGDRAAQLSARLPVRIFEQIAASGLRSSFHLDSQRDAASLGIESLSRQISALRAEDAGEVAVGRADFRASQRALEAARAMERIDPASRGVDRATAAAILATTQELREQVAEQGRQVDLSERYSARGGKSVFALSLVAIAAALLGLAAVFRGGPGGRIALTAGALALAGSGAWGVWALTI
ncbi:MAG: hypothetical protein ABR521_02995 [Gaiellaceae bacterium]